MTALESLEAPARRRRLVMLRLLGMRLLTRLLLLVCSLSLVSLLLLSRCGLNIDSADQQQQLVLGPGDAAVASAVAAAAVAGSSVTVGAAPGSQTQTQTINSYAQLLQQREEESRLEVARLTSEIRSLKRQLLQLTNQGGNALRLNSSSGSAGEFSEYLKRQTDAAEIYHGLPLNNEYELIAFNHFTFSRVYPVELGLGKRVVEKPIGFKRKDLLDALVQAVAQLNRNVTTKNQRYSLDDFLEGLYRTEPTTGTQYELYFRSKGNSSPSGYHKVVLMRPFAPVRALSAKGLAHKDKELIHVIVPLGGRISTFHSFMDKFVKIALKNDRRVALTVVYFGDSGLTDARNIMSRVLMTRNSGATPANFRLLALNETFSRSKGLRVGAETPWPGGSINTGNDILLFLCDVDIVFSARFLDRCRWNTEQGQKVYYPVVFSLYNPHVVYTLQGKQIPPETDQLVISRDTGFWRDFGYGMTCQYRSDFLKVRGFDEDIVGWGGEDVMLYRKYVRSHVKVVRATDPGIFHIWHPKVCGFSNGPGGPRQKWSADQYRACIRSRALNEASHAQLGFLAFREEMPSSNGTLATPATKKPPPARHKTPP